MSALLTGKLSNRPRTVTVVPDRYDMGTRATDPGTRRPSRSNRNCSPRAVVDGDDDCGEDPPRRRRPPPPAPASASAPASPSPPPSSPSSPSSFSSAVRVHTTRDRERLARQKSASPRNPRVGAQSSSPPPRPPPPSSYRSSNRRSLLVACLAAMCGRDDFGTPCPSSVTSIAPRP